VSPNGASRGRARGIHAKGNSRQGETRQTNHADRFRRSKADAATDAEIAFNEDGDSFDFCGDNGCKRSGKAVDRNGTIRSPQNR
jgi:hypothetical protein